MTISAVMGVRRSNLSNWIGKKLDSPSSDGVSISMRWTLVSILLAVNLMSCGTTHHFIPPQPLETGDWQLSISWHYDFGKLSSNGGMILPDVYAYYGLSDEVMIGTGATGFLTPTFASAAYYHQVNQSEYWLAYAHYKLLSGHDNPMLDMGLGYSKRSGSTTQMGQLGIGFGYQLPVFGESLVQGTPIRWSIKYGVMGRDFGVNFSHYHGTTSMIIKAFFPSWPPHEDTVAIYEQGEIVDIERDKTAFCEKWNLIGSDGDTIVMNTPCSFPDQFFSWPEQIDAWAGDDLSYIFFGKDFALVNLDELKGQVERGEKIVLVRAPISITDRVDGPWSWKEDSSVGWGLFAYPGREKGNSE